MKHVPGKKTLEKTQLDIMIAGVPHQFGWGGVHGAIPKYSGEGFFLNMDVASLYPSLMIRYNLHSRNMKDPKKYEEIYHTRLKYKAEKNPLQAPLKLVLNSTYGVMKDKNNGLYDPLQANRVCVYGQLLLLDLIEKLEPHCQIIQSNTDGVLVKLPDGSDETFELFDDICFEWEQRTGLQLEFDEYRKVFQKDVNNYIIVDAAGNHKSKGGYVKKLSSLDYDLPIVNKALIRCMVHNVPVDRTINECDELKEFQLVSKISGKYTMILHGEKRVNEKCIRIFASKNESDAGVKKVHAKKGRPEKISNSPEHCFIIDVKLISYLPQFIQDYREIKEILKNEDPEIFGLNTEIEQFRNNQFILTCDEVGIGRFEKFLGIIPSTEDTLNTRISMVITRWNDSIPYTFRGLVEKLDSLCGVDNYVIGHNFNEYKIFIKILIRYAKIEKEVRNLLKSMLPANIESTIFFTHITTSPIKLGCHTSMAQHISIYPYTPDDIVANTRININTYAKMANKITVYQNKKE